ncbi:MAG TPA: hypothetical protein PK573_12580 [Spirochaetota bacterium]|nr:hypothetical protein [Spirochaetota bacterium]HRZ27116.1 hypothetical protein [Spirochaetota bacterium]HSA14946.1 hypothetical protein [Spirochaetota bacterium]
MVKKTVSAGILLAALALLMTTPSCGPASRADMIKENKTFRLPYGPKQGKALIYVVRDNPFGGLVKFNVYVDSMKDSRWMGGCMGGQFIHCYVRPGRHTLYSKTEGPIASVSISTQAGGVYYVQLAATVGAFVANPLLSLLDSVNGKHQLSNCREGNQGKTNL